MAERQYLTMQRQSPDGSRGDQRPLGGDACSGPIAAADAGRVAVKAQDGPPRKTPVARCELVVGRSSVNRSH